MSKSIVVAVVVIVAKVMMMMLLPGRRLHELEGAALRKQVLAERQGAVDDTFQVRLASSSYRHRRGETDAFYPLFISGVVSAIVTATYDAPLQIPFS